MDLRIKDHLRIQDSFFCTLGVPNSQVSLYIDANTHHMALATIARKSVARQTASLWTRVKLDFVCLYPTDNQIWSSNNLRVTFAPSKVHGSLYSILGLTFKSLSIRPSLASNASQSLQRNRYLETRGLWALTLCLNTYQIRLSEDDNVVMGW